MWKHSFCHKPSFLGWKKIFQRPVFDQHTSLAVLVTAICLPTHTQSRLFQVHAKVHVPPLTAGTRRPSLSPPWHQSMLIKAAQVRTAPCLKANLQSFLCRLSLTQENTLLKNHRWSQPCRSKNALQTTWKTKERSRPAGWSTCIHPALKPSPCHCPLDQKLPMSSTEFTSPLTWKQIEFSSQTDKKWKIIFICLDSISP